MFLVCPDRGPLRTIFEEIHDPECNIRCCCEMNTDCWHSKTTPTQFMGPAMGSIASYIDGDLTVHDLIVLLEDMEEFFPKVHKLEEFTQFVTRLSSPVTSPRTRASDND